jgi:hypothetical protein
MSVTDAFMIIIDDYRVMLQIVAPLTKDSRVVIYNRNVFIVQGGYCCGITKHFIENLTIIIMAGVQKAS